MKNFLICLLVCAVVMLNFSCTGDYKQQPLPPDVIAISSGTQGFVGDVSIGAGNFNEGEYEIADGKKQQGQTARLWITVGNDSSSNKTFLVGKGSKFSAGQLSFEVVEVTNDRILIRYSPSR